MKKSAPLLLFLLLTGFACRGSKPEGTATPATTADTTAKTTPTPAASGGMTVVKANISRVKGTVTEIHLTDSLNFRMAVHIDSASALGDMATLATPGDVVTLAPHFVLTPAGGVDTTNDRNHRILNLRALKNGSPFKGKISMGSPGNWTIVDADTL